MASNLPQNRDMLMCIPQSAQQEPPTTKCDEVALLRMSTPSVINKREEGKKGEKLPEEG